MKMLVTAFAISLLGVGLLQEYRPQRPVLEGVSFGFNERKPSFSPDSLRLMSFGYPRVFSSLLWLRFLQYTPPERSPEDGFSWIYYDLEAISDLDPDFIPAYENAGIFLSVVTTDKKGAELIFLKGIRRFPERWRLHAYLAYHYEHELDDREQAGRYYVSGAALPDAPELVRLLATRFTENKDALRERIAFLEKLQASFDNEGAKRRLGVRIEMLKRDLKNGGGGE